jgi:exopolyphosphatase / guanosine-5'-triphosphate,3'-diphosphate pyrophosphatase
LRFSSREADPGVKDHLRLASFDIGTNSTRMLVADCDGVHTETVCRRMAITRLGEGVDETHRLTPAAVERTEAAIAGFVEEMTPLGPVAVAAAATSALRDCENGQEFVDATEELIGARPLVLAGDDEARLSFLGAASDLSGELGEGPCTVLVFDIGGGSTELIVGAAPSALEDGVPMLTDLALKSIDVGCVRMSERFLRGSDPPSPVSVGRMESFIVARLKPAVEMLLGGEKPALAVGLAGTVTTLSGINLGLEEYDTDRIHHSRLTRARVEEIFVRLATVTLEERKRMMGLEPGRADIIVGGTAVLRVVMDLLGLEEILVSEKDILDGLVLDLYFRQGRCNKR